MTGAPLSHDPLARKESAVATGCACPADTAGRQAALAARTLNGARPCR